MDTKKGYESYKHFANEPTITLGPGGIDAIGCKEKLSASFWNGKNFAC